MIKKIICPTDFSTEAFNATGYAARLAKTLDAELLLVHVESVPLASGVMLAGGLMPEVHESSEKALERLQKTCAELKKEFNIKASFEVDITSQPAVKILATAGSEDTMLVIGAKSPHKLKDFFFGTGTYTIIKKTKCPVLFVPENCAYSSYHNVLYAMAYEEKSRNAMDAFYEFIKPFGANVTVLHISKHPGDLGKDLFRAETEEIEEHFAGKLKFNFDQLYSEYVIDAISTYAEKQPADLLVMAVRHRNLFESLFKHKPLLAGLTNSPSFPVLVFHS